MSSPNLVSVSVEASKTDEVYWNDFRKELKDWFQANAPTLGALYEGALRVLYSRQFPAKERFVGHAVREIRNCLPEIIAGRNTRGPIQYVNKLDSLVEDFGKAGLALDGVLPSSLSPGSQNPSANVEIPTKIYKKIAELLREHDESRKKRADAAFGLFEGVASENRGFRDALRPVVTQWLDITEWFMKRTHESMSDRSIDETELLPKFEIFESTLGGLIRGFFKTSRSLDEILEDANS